MKFSEYIAESTAYKNQRPMTKDECIDYIRKNCNQMDYSSPLLRGMKGTSNYIKIEEMGNQGFAVTAIICTQHY